MEAPRIVDRAAEPPRRPAGGDHRRDDEREFEPPAPPAPEAVDEQADTDMLAAPIGRRQTEEEHADQAIARKVVGAGELAAGETGCNARQDQQEDGDE